MRLAVLGVLKQCCTGAPLRSRTLFCLLLFNYFCARLNPYPTVSEDRIYLHCLKRRICNPEEKINTPAVFSGCGSRPNVADPKNKAATHDLLDQNSQETKAFKLGTKNSCTFGKKI